MCFLFVLAFRWYESHRLICGGNRVDLEYALYMGSTTQFHIEDVLSGNETFYGLRSSFGTQDDRELILSELHNSRPIYKQLPVDLRDLLVDTTAYAKLLNDTSTGKLPKLDGRIFHVTMVLVGYRLVRISPLGGVRLPDSVSTAVHLGLVAFLTTFLRQLDRRIPEIQLLYQLFRPLVQQYTDDSKDGDERENQMVLLWLLFIGEAAVFKQPDDEWLLPKAARTIDALGLDTWDDANKLLTTLPWVNIVHNCPGEALWHRSVSYRSSRQDNLEYYY